MEVNSRIGKMLRWKVLPLIVLVLVVTMAVQALTNMRSANGSINTLPIPGESFTVTVSGGDTGFVTISLVSVSHHPGVYTNDFLTDTSPDFDLSAFGSGTGPEDTDSFPHTSGSPLVLHPLDYGGSITILVETTTDGIPESLEVTIPADSDSDGLPDAWELQTVGNLTLMTGDGDIDSSVDPNDPSKTGDGLSNFEEYRGVKYGQLAFQSVLDSYGTYQTPAFIPVGIVPDMDGRFSTDPTRKDLYMMYTGYGVSDPNYPVLTADPVTPEFAIGTAFDNAGVDVHAMDAADVSTVGTANIDVLQITNSLTVNYLAAKDSVARTYKAGKRFFLWHTVGDSGVGSSADYGANCTTFQKALNFYFGDRPYLNGGVLGGPFDVIPPNDFLDPVNGSLVQDQNDNGINDFLFRKKGVKFYEAGGKDDPLDGDVVKIGEADHDFSVFDCDGNGLVEQPQLTDCENQIGGTIEITKSHNAKHNITHEAGHACGLLHNNVFDSLMYSQSPNWMRDDLFSPDSLAQMKIHNDFDGDGVGSHNDADPTDEFVQ